VAQPTLQPRSGPARLQPLGVIAREFRAGAAQVILLALTKFPEAPAERILGPEEAERARQRVAPVVRRGFVAGRWLLRSVLAAVAGVEPRLLEFRAGTHGKLFLAGHEQLGACFNLSHSGELAGLALVRARRIGLDIEAERQLTDAALLARRILGPRERERFEALPESARGDRLLAVWTRKEAVLKAIGIGISGGLSSVEVLADTVVSAGEASATWSVRTLSMPPGFRGAIAIEGEAPRLLIWEAVPQP
jgi:4'-phosphopantetheinyl transferase